MATVDIKPTVPTSGAGNWSISGDNSPANCVNAYGDSKSIIIDNYNAYGDSCVFSSFGLGSVPLYIVINSITGYYYASRASLQTGTMKQMWALGGAYTSGAQQTPVSGYLSDSMGRPGGGSWTRSDLSNLQVKYYAYGDAGAAGKTMRIDEMIIRIDYSYITLASLAASDATGISSSGATIAGSYNANGDGDTEWRMVYGTSTGSYDSPAWTSASGSTGSVTAPTRTLTGLNANTTYYYRLEARNSADTAQYSAEKTFTTSGSAGGLILFF